MKKIIHEVIDFIVTMIYFVKQTFSLAKNVFGKNKPSVEYKDLTPVDDVTVCDEHIKALTWAILSAKSKNIALSGPYGSGKSSIINTFLRRNPLLQEKSLKISLATFTDTTESNKQGSIIHTGDLEESILKQLFYKIDQRKIPQSRYRKIHKLSCLTIFGRVVFSVIIALVFMFVFWPDTLKSGTDLIVAAGSKLYTYGINLMPDCFTIKHALVIFLKKHISFVSLSTFGVFCLALLYCGSRMAHQFVSRLSITSIKFPGDMTVESGLKETESIFNKNMDEILYFFEVTEYRLVFIEDLDRFRDPEIFIKLRELNIILNNSDSIKDPVIFVYAIQDDMFKDDERTKFFDFIIPVIPVINATNSCDCLLEMLNVVDGKSTKHDITRGYVLDISPYIADMRILQNIYNEFILYKETLKVGQKLSLHDELMMSLIVFKNLFPDQFAKLQAEKGIVKQAFRDKKTFIDKEILELKKQIEEKREILNAIDHDTLANLHELKYTMLCAVTEWKGFANRIRINGGESYPAETILKDEFDVQKLLKKGQWIVTYSLLKGGSSEIWPDVPNLCKPFVRRQEYLKYAGQKSKEELRLQIQTFESKVRELSIQPLWKLIEEYGADKVLATIDKEKYAILVFMLRKGYITEEYSGYINFFKENSITKEDMNFIISIKNQSPLRFTYPLTKIAETLERLQLHEFSEKAALNFDLLNYMLESHTHYADQLCEFFKQLSDGSSQSWDFIDQFIKIEETQKAFVKQLASSWEGLWDSVFDNSELTYDRKIEYLALLLFYLDFDTLKKQNASRKISRFFEMNKDILQKLPAALVNRIKLIIPALEIKFVCIEIDAVPPELLNFIFDNGHYILNPNMIRSIVTFKDKSLLDLLEKQNYTVVRKISFAPLMDMISENWELYLEQNVLTKGNTKESVQAVLDLLSRSIGSIDLCKRIIDHEDFQIEKISQVCSDCISTEKENVQAVWDYLLKSSKINVSWINVYTYWKEFSLSSRLKKHIIREYPVLSESDSGCLDDDFKSEIILSDISIKAFIALLPCIAMDKFDIALEDIAPDKLCAMIQNRSFEFTIQDYKELTACAPDLCATYILLNQEAFAEKMDNIELTELVFEELIMSTDLNTMLRERILNRDGVNLMTVESASYLSKLNIPLSRALFKSIWEKIDATQKKDFFIKHISIFTVYDIEEYLIELGPPYHKLKRTAVRHDEFIPDTPENRLLVDRLVHLQYLTSREYETQTQYGSKNSAKIKHVIRCRVKIKQEEAVSTK